MIETSVVKSSHFSGGKGNIFFQYVRLFAYEIFFWLLGGLSALSAESLPVPMSLDWGPSTYSFAGAAAAMASDHDAFLTNPAGLVYYAQSSSFGGSWQQMPGDQSHWTTTLVDGTHDLIGGFQFAWSEVGSLTRNAYTFDSAYKTPYGIVGVSIHAHRFAGVPEGKGWHFTNSIGTIIPIGEMISIGIYSKSPYDLEKNHDLLPPSVHMGVMYSKPGALRATFESGRRFRTPDQDWYYAAAGDFLMQEYLAIRGGYRWAPKNEPSFWSVGAALLAPKIEIIGAFIRTTSDSSSNGFGVDATFKF